MSHPSAFSIAAKESVMRHLSRLLCAAALFGVAVAHAAGLPTCTPSRFGTLPLGGAGSPVQTVRTSAGTGYAYKCLDGSVNWKAVRSDYKGPTAADLLAEAMTFKSPAEAILALWAKYDSPPVSDPEYEALVAATITSGKSILFGYVVAKNGTSPTRAAYLVTNGVRATVSKATVPVGSACKCATPPPVAGAFCDVAVTYATLCVPAGT